MKLLSDKGSEFIVYSDEDYVYKLFRKDYKLKHKAKEELEYMSSIRTKRILMPTSLIIKDGELRGYKMPYIKGKSNILDAKMEDLIQELRIVDEDIKLLSKALIRLMDINLENTIFNGELYLIDPGNYFLNDIKDLISYLTIIGQNTTNKKEIIELWNYDKLNKLLDELLFINNNEVDFYLLRKIIEFFNCERTKIGAKFNLSILETHFDRTLTVREAINKFIKKHIKIDEQEKQIFLSLIKK